MDALIQLTFVPTYVRRIKDAWEVKTLKPRYNVFCWFLRLKNNYDKSKQLKRYEKLRGHLEGVNWSDFLQDRETILQKKKTF